AGAVAAEDGDAVAVPDLQVERVGQTFELKLFADHRPFADTATGQPYPDVLFFRAQRWWSGLLELRQAGLRALQSAGHVGVVRRLLPIHRDQLLEFSVFVVQASTQLVEAFVAGLPGLVPGV